MYEDKVFGFLDEQVRQMCCTYSRVTLKQLLNFLRVNHSKSTTSEDVISVTSWLAKYLGTEVHIIKQESQVSTQIKKKGFSLSPLVI